MTADTSASVVNLPLQAKLCKALITISEDKSIGIVGCSLAINLNMSASTLVKESSMCTVNFNFFFSASIKRCFMTTT